MLKKEEVLHIAKLAKLTLAEDEIETYRRQISEILDYFKQLDEVDTSNVPPTSHVVDIKNRFQEEGLTRGSNLLPKSRRFPIDVPGGFLQVEPLLIEEVLRNAGRIKGRYIQTDPIL